LSLTTPGPGGVRSSAMSSKRHRTRLTTLNAAEKSKILYSVFGHVETFIYRWYA